MGPWRAAQRFLASCGARGGLDAVTRVRVDLYGSLAKTGKGHGTDFAVMLGLSGHDPVTCDPAALPGVIDRIRASKSLPLAGSRPVHFDPDRDIIFHLREALPFHANGIRFTAYAGEREVGSETYYSVGGGFVVQEN